MKPIVTIIILLLLQNICLSQNERKSEIYFFINSTIKSDTSKFNLKDKMVTYPFEEFDYHFLKDSLFDSNDIDTFMLQINNSKNLIWDKTKIENAKIIDSKSLKKIFKRKKLLHRIRKQNGWTKFRKKYGICLTTYSLPLFSKNYKYCIFYEWTQCDYLMGSGNIVLYEKINEKWTFVKFMMTGIS